MEIHDPTISAFLHQAGLNINLPTRVVPLRKPSNVDFKSSSPSSSDAALSLLVRQRTAESGGKSNEKSLKQRFSLVRLKEHSEQTSPSFSKHEVAKGFNRLLSHVPLPEPGIAQAILDHASGCSIQELWRHLHDAKLEKRKSGLFKRSRASDAGMATWLGHVTTLDSVDYIRAICHVGVEDETLDAAFSIAWSKRSMEAMKVLLSYGAVASPHRLAIRERFSTNDVPLARLLLSAPNALSNDDWAYCIEGQARTAPIVVTSCIMHRPILVSKKLLLNGIESGNLEIVASILAHAGSSEDIHNSHDAACQLTSFIEDPGKRWTLFRMLAEAGLLLDGDCLRRELMRSVKLNQMDLIRLLVDTGVTLDVEPTNVFSWAVSRMSFDLLELFVDGCFAAPVWRCLDRIPYSASETDIMRFLYTFRSKPGLTNEQMSALLIQSAKRKHLLLVERLVSYGVSIEAEEALAITNAISDESFEVLTLLLKGQISPAKLSPTMAIAMSLRSRPSRLRMMKLLVEKGIQSEVLGMAIQWLVSEDDDVDIVLLQMILKHGAIVDRPSPQNNPIIASIKKGNLLVVKMLCEAKPGLDTLSWAVPVAFEARRNLEYDTVLDMIKYLLDKGARGEPVNQTLIRATTKDSRIEIARVLVEHGADANYKGGDAFAVAINTGNLELLKVLCVACPPSQTTLEKLLRWPFHPDLNNEEVLDMVLGSSPSSKAALNSVMCSETSFEQIKHNRTAKAIIPGFLKYGGDVNFGNGVLLLDAIETKDAALLKSILLKDPSSESLRKAFQGAYGILDKSLRFEMMELLLSQAGPGEIGQSTVLCLLTHEAVAGDSTGLKLVLQHRASVDFNKGSAVQVAAHAGSMETLRLLVAYRPVASTIHRACLAVVSSKLSTKAKREVYELLLAAGDGLDKGDLTVLLAESIASFPAATELPALLLSRGAGATTETIKLALTRCSHGILMSLLTTIQTSVAAQDVFQYVRKTPNVPSNQRLRIYKYLLGKRMPRLELCYALFTALQESRRNLDVVSLLLEHGATIGYDKGRAFKLAASGDNSGEVFKLLVKYVRTDLEANLAFDRANSGAIKLPSELIEIYRQLLRWNIDKASVQAALEDCLQAGNTDCSFVQMLLRQGADPNANNGLCFGLALLANSEPIFRSLSRYAKLGVVLLCALRHLKEEGQIVHWINICLEERPRGAKFDQDDLLFACLQQFPNGTALLKLILDNGVSASTTRAMKLSEGWEPEKVTALLWSLFATPRIENDPILVLLSRGKDAVRPAYSSPTTEVSAALGCLLDESRTPVLKALLKLDQTGIMANEVPRSSFSQLSAGTKASFEDISDLPERLSLHWASLFLGNYEAFRLVHNRTGINDGLLHTAALHALPKFVKWLLKTDDPNLKEESFDYWIPLAVVCLAKPQPWSKIANEKSDFKARQKATMRLLAPRTSSKWDYRGKSVLHIALENGIDTTKAMVSALEGGAHRHKKHAYRYEDRDGKQYSLSEYVTEFVDAKPAEKKTLIKCLINGGFESRSSAEALGRAKSAGALKPKPRRILERKFSAIYED